MSKWKIQKRTTKPEPIQITGEICRVVPPRLARIPNISEWILRPRVKRSTRYVADLLKRRYSELRLLLE